MGKDLNGKELGVGIRQRENGSYEGRFVNKLGKRKSIYADTLTELRQLMSKAIYEESVHTDTFGGEIKLDDWFERWMTLYKDDLRPSSKMTYELIYHNHVSPVLGKYAVKDITNMNIKAFLKIMNEVKGLSYSVRNTSKIMLQDMFKVAISNNLIIRNPVYGIKLGKKPKSDVQVLSQDDQRGFLDCAKGTFYYNMFVAHISSGLRPGELYALTADDIDFENNTISITKTLSYQKFEGDTGKTFHLGEPKTEQSVRVVPMNSICREALQRQIIQSRIVKSKAPESKKLEGVFADLLFTTKYGTPINTQIYTDAIKKIVDEVNLTRVPPEYIEKLHPHVFRHTFATRCFEAGISPKTIQSYLGHATLKMTMDLYVHVTELHATNEMPKFETLMENITDDIDIAEGKVIDINTAKLAI